MRNRLLTALLALGTIACADATAPVPQRANLARTGGTTAPAPTSTQLVGLRRNAPLAGDVTYSQTIGAAGGTFTVPGTGLTVVVPAKAVSAATTFQVRALSGAMVAYEFEPHGTTFAVPLRMTQSYEGTNYAGLADKSAVEVGYFASTAALDRTANTATVSEILRVSPDAARSALQFSVSHFSGYMLSSGRNNK